MVNLKREPASVEESALASPFADRIKGANPASALKQAAPHKRESPLRAGRLGAESKLADRCYWFIPKPLSLTF